MNVELRVGTVAETITVTGEAPIVDVQSSLRERVMSKDVMDVIKGRRAGGEHVPELAGRSDHLELYCHERPRPAVAGAGVVGRRRGRHREHRGSGPDARRAIDQLDLRLSKVLRAGRMRANLNLDIFNAFNGNAIRTVNTNYASWLTPTAILDARLFKISVQLDF